MTDEALGDAFAEHADESLAIAEETFVAAAEVWLRAEMETCVHCGRPGSRASINGARVCHADWKSGVPLAQQDDCYRMVTVYGEPLGSRIVAA